MEKLIQYALDERKTKLKNALRRLNDMIGMDEVKESVALQVQRHIMDDMFQKSKLAKAESATNVTTRSRARIEQKNRLRKRKRSYRHHHWTRKKSKRRQTATGRTAAKNTELKEEDAGLELLKMIIGSNRSKEKKQGGEAATMPRIQFVHDDADAEWGIGDSDDDEGDEDEEEDEEEEDYEGYKFHTLLIGPPGCGKTTVARKIADVWEAAGIVNGTFSAIGRTHVMSKWQGEASEKIRDAIEDTRGGVLFVDECYGLVHGSNDTYGNEVLTAIVQAMTDTKCGTTFIFAGYEKDVKSKIFSANAGLERRFDAIYKIGMDDPTHLAKIFLKLNKDDGWDVTTNLEEIQQLFTTNKADIKFGGADAESIAEEARREHSERFFPHVMDRKLTSRDIQKGMKKFLQKKASHRQKSLCTHMFL